MKSIRTLYDFVYCGFSRANFDDNFCIVVLYPSGPGLDGGAGKGQRKDGWHTVSLDIWSVFQKPEFA
jgi:hypothetical protein